MYFGDEKAISVDKDKLKNLGIMSSKNEKEAKMLSNVVSDDKINYAHLKNIAQELKEVKDETEFYALFGFKNGKTRGNVKTPIKEVEIDLQEAWQHLQDNSKKENRLKLAGGILPTLQTPNVVSVDKNGTYFFYKAFKDEKGVLNLVSVELPKSNRLQYKTSYIASKQRLLKIFNEYEVIYENYKGKTANSLGRSGYRTYKAYLTAT